MKNKKNRVFDIRATQKDIRSRLLMLELYMSGEIISYVCVWDVD